MLYFSAQGTAMSQAQAGFLSFKCGTNIRLQLNFNERCRNTDEKKFQCETFSLSARCIPAGLLDSCTASLLSL